MDAGFALVLIVALLLGGGLSYLQHRAYSKATQRLLAAYRDRFGSVLISGRGKGWGRGAVVLLIVDTLDRKIVAAEAMIGVTVLARFKPRPELLGPLMTAPVRAGREIKLAQAVEYAIEQYKVPTRKKAARAASPR